MRGLPGEILCFDNNFFSSYIKPFNISNQKNKFQVFFYLKSIVFFFFFRNKKKFFGLLHTFIFFKKKNHKEFFLN